jgi:hypothetical protein
LDGSFDVLAANLFNNERKDAFVPRISWIEEGDARGQLADLFAAARSGTLSGIPREHVPDIIRTMSHRPDFLAAIMDAARMHFSEGALTRAQHEMIASYVSALNRCHY